MTARKKKTRREVSELERAARFPVWLVIDARYLHRGLVRVYSDTVLFHCNYTVNYRCTRATAAVASLFRSVRASKKPIRNFLKVVI